MTDIELIAKFTGYQILNKKFEIKSYNSSNEYYWTSTEGDVVCNSAGNIMDNEDQEPIDELDDLPFRSSWDWLMEAVEKIINTPLDGESNIKHHLRTFTEKSGGDNYMVRFNGCQLHYGDTLLRATFTAVVAFIKMYNLNKEVDE